jgi:cell division protein FtsQ
VSPAQATVPAAPRTAGRTLRALVPGPLLRRRLAALVFLAALLFAGYMLWLRDSGIVAVRTVKVTGLSGPDSGRIRAALDAAGRNMTTLHVDEAALEQSVSAFPVVRGIEVSPAFLHELRVHVLRRRPAALLVTGSGRVAVAGDGTVLPGLPVKGGVPLIRIDGALPARQVAGRADLAAVNVAGGIPEPLKARVKTVRRDASKGVVVPLQGGPKLIFGDATRLAAKWAAAVAVLADESAARADYVDVRIPERPVAGGLRVETVAPAAPAAAPAALTPPASSAAPAAASPTSTSAQPASPASSAPAAPSPAVPATPAPTLAAGGGAAAPNPQP